MLVLRPEPGSWEKLVLVGELLLESLEVDR